MFLSATPGIPGGVFVRYENRTFADDLRLYAKVAQM